MAESARTVVHIPGAPEYRKLIRKVRITNDSEQGSASRTDIYDGLTGEKISNVYQIDLSLSRFQHRVHIETACAWEYEGPAEIRRVRVGRMSDREPVFVEIETLDSADVLRESDNNPDEYVAIRVGELQRLLRIEREAMGLLDEQKGEPS